MTFEQCSKVLGTLALTLRAEMDLPTLRAYHRVLRDAEFALLQVAADGFVKAGIRFIPTAPELLAACEKARRQWLATHPYEGCVECEHSRGWRQVLGGDGQPTVEPCPCKARYQEQVGSMAGALAALPGEVDGQSEQVYPSAAQLPGELRQKLEAVTARKALS